MKLTDKNIIEALKAGKKIRINKYPSREAKLINGYLEYCDNHKEVLVWVDLLERDDFEIVKPEIDWDKIIKENFLCKFWDGLERPDVLYHVGILSNFDKTIQTFTDRAGTDWRHCRPLRADEVKLLDEEKELWK